MGTAVDGCEILHHQVGMVETLQKMMDNYHLSTGDSDFATIHSIIRYESLA